MPCGAHMIRLLWLMLGLSAVALGVIGIFLPLLPTTPFMILAAAAFAKSSDRLHRWLMTHRTFGPMIGDWQRYRAIPTRAKRLAIVSMAAAFGLSLAMQLPLAVLVAQATVLVIMGTWIATRPSGPPKS